MKKPNLKILLKISLVFNILLLIAISFLLYRSGYAVKVINMLTSSNSIASPASNPQYQMRGSMFEFIPDSHTDVVFVGDSITQNCNWNEFFLSYSIKNRGIGSDTTKGVLERIDDVIRLKPVKVFLMIGVNDVRYGVDNDEVINNYKELFNVLRKSLPETEMYIQSILPTSDIKNNKKIEKLNSIIQQESKNHGFEYVNLYDDFVDENDVLKSNYTADGLHLMGDAYKVWIDKISKYLK